MLVYVLSRWKWCNISGRSWYDPARSEYQTEAYRKCNTYVGSDSGAYEAPLSSKAAEG